MARSSIYPPSVQPGKPHLGEAPPGWKTYRFADLFEVVERPASLRDDEEYQLITAKRSRGGVVARERLRGKDILTKTQFYVAEDDFVISNRQIIHGGCGIVPAALDGAIVSNEYTVLRPKPVLLLDYLRYLPHTVYFQQTCFHASVGVDVEKMVFDVDQWMGFRVHLPSLALQQAISEVLLRVDDAINADCATIEHLLSARNALLNQLVVHGANAHGGNSCLFESLSIADVSAFVTSGSRGWAQFYSENGNPFIRISNLNRSDIRLDLSDLKRVSLPKDVTEGRRTKIAPGDILISITADLGMVGIVGNDFNENAYISQHIALVRLSSNKLIPRFLAYALSSGEIQKQILSKNDGGTKAGLNLQAIRDIKLQVPSLDEQHKVVGIMSAADRCIQAAKSKMDHLIHLRAAMIYGLFSGTTLSGAFSVPAALTGERP